MKIKIALVDDEQLIIEGVKFLLSKEKNIAITVTANTGSEFLAHINEISSDQYPDIALIDIQMQPMDGFELVGILKDQHPHLKIIILSSHYKSSTLGYMVKLGVSAFLPKNSEKKSFVEAISLVYKYGVFFTADDQALLLTYLNNSQKKKSLFTIEDELSEREIDVVKLICRELTNKEIADKLSLSPRTVESHRQRILEKIGAKNSIGIVIYAVIHGIHKLEIAL